MQLSNEIIINVVSPLPSGKTTLINALLGKKLLPYATIPISVVHKDINEFKEYAFAFDKDKKMVTCKVSPDRKTLKEWTENKSVTNIEIEGQIPFLKRNGANVRFIDNPSYDMGATRSIHYPSFHDSDISIIVHNVNWINLELLLVR